MIKLLFLSILASSCIHTEAIPSQQKVTLDSELRIEQKGPIRRVDCPEPGLQQRHSYFTPYSAVGLVFRVDKKKLKVAKDFESSCPPE